MTDFDPIFAWTIRWEEKVLEQVEGDAGGLTFWGISRVNNPSWPGWHLVDNHLAACGGSVSSASPICNQDAILTGITEQFYDDAYVKGGFGGITYPELALQVFDKDWNMGNRAVKALQSLVMVKADGIIGPKTLAAINDHINPSALVDQFLQAIKAIYIGIVERHPDQGKFLHGWLNRDVRTDKPAPASLDLASIEGAGAKPPRD